MSENSPKVFEDAGLWQNCTTPLHHLDFGMVIFVWDRSQVHAIPNSDQPPLRIHLTFPFFCLRKTQTFTFTKSYLERSFQFGKEVMASILNYEGWLGRVWDSLKLGSIPNCFLLFGMHPKLYWVYPKHIPKRGVVQFRRALGLTLREVKKQFITLAHFSYWWPP